MSSGGTPPSKTSTPANVQLSRQASRGFVPPTLNVSKISLPPSLRMEMSLEPPALLLASSSSPSLLSTNSKRLSALLYRFTSFQEQSSASNHQCIAMIEQTNKIDHPNPF